MRLPHVVCFNKQPYLPNVSAASETKSILYFEGMGYRKKVSCSSGLNVLTKGDFGLLILLFLLLECQN